MTHRDRVAAALERERTDRAPMQIAFTPEFARRLRADLALEGEPSGNPHAAEAEYDLELAVGVDILRASVGWVNSYYKGDRPYVDEWGVGFVPAPYATRFGTGYYTEPLGHPLADAAALDAYRVRTRSGPSCTPGWSGSSGSTRASTGSWARR